MLIASAKPRSTGEASHQTAFMSGCLTIGHTCLSCLPSDRKLVFWRCLFAVGRDVSWEGGKGVWGEWGEKGEKGEKAGKGGIKVSCHGWRGRNVMRRQFGKGGRVVSRKGGMEFNDKIVLYCSRESKCKQGFTAGIWYYLYDILDYQSYTDIGDLMVNTFDLRWGDRGSFPGWRRYEFAFQLFLGF